MEWLRKRMAMKVKHIDALELKGYMNDKTVKRQYIDVRSPEEFRQKSIKGFKNIPLQLLFFRMNEISKDAEVVLICASGARSMQAARTLNQNGYDQVINVRGGMMYVS